MSDLVLFGALPYVAMVIFLVVTIQRYRQQTFSYSSLSSQFIENRQHFWSSVPFHYGILGVLAIHVAAFALPGAVLAWNGEPVRLVVLEVSGFALAILTVVGLVNIVARRIGSLPLRRVTSVSDWVLYALLFVQVGSGIAVAWTHSWGSSWFATSASPWLWSLVTLSPDVSYVAPLPLLVKVHVVNAWVLIGVFPFTRLVHVLVIPNMYLWRRPQLVIWNHRTGKGA